MKPRPFYRRKSFWLGLFVLVFLGWAWWQSFHHCVRLNIPLGGGKSVGKALAGFRQDGETVFVKAHRDASQLLSFRTTPRRGGSLGLKDYCATADQLGFRWILIPDSLVFFPALALWLGWLFWHWKREQKKTSSAFLQKL